ncbi:AraC family transcriptional regulator [Sphingobium nicotianae]|uniref:AraC family transcriptional regulator n=1 Tax=Sphingobium nicotianae TaxID=2782607 RepID=A0A9X1DCC0_9SPHN|nr:helix-turn-helix domain-containing protein [Sphingobium nicotianae]MBT2187495.1 AraC family transcriptional regulator [Sphingobium nicotianae]
MSIQLDYAVPGPALSDYVTLFYWFRADIPYFEDVERADHAQIRFRLTSGGATYRFVDGNDQSVSDAHLVGPTTGAFRAQAAGPVHVFGAGLTPAGWAAIVGGDASTMINRALDLSDLFGQAAADEAIRQIDAAPDLAAKAARCEAILGRLMRSRRDRLLGFVRQVDGWLCADSSPAVEMLVRATGLSRRQVERKCRALYGAPPKLLARKYRALRAAVALLAEGVSIDEAIGMGFYDQPHMNREIKQFTGYTPGQMRSEPGLLAQLTIAQRYALGGQVHPIISDT